MAASASASSPSSAVVRLEVRIGNGSRTVYEVGDGGFLIGSVPGCDLRLPGTNLAPVICLVSRHAGGASLRKLAPVQPVGVNGKALSAAYLHNGDRISVGAAEIAVAIEAGQAAAPAGPAVAGLLERARLIEAREKELVEKTQELETNRVIWYRRREEIEAECRRQTQRLEELTLQARQQERDLTGAHGDLEVREQDWRVGQEALARRERELDARAEELSRQEGEVGGLRRELLRIRTEFTQRYQQRRERLVTQQQAIRRAAQRVQARKRAVDEQEARLRPAQEEWALRQAEIDARGEQVERERQLLDDQHRLLASRQQELQRDLAQRLEEVQAREQAIVTDRIALEKGQKQHQADLVRLDRIQAGIEGRQKQLEQRALEIDKKFEQLQRDSRDLEEQAAQMDEWHNRLSAETERLAAQKKEQQALVGQVDQRAGALEGQQAMLVTLRSRLERMRDELRRQEQALGDQRALQEASEADIRARLEEAERIRGDLVNERQLFDEERRRFEERRATLEQAVAQLRQAQEAQAADQAVLQQRQQEVDATAAEQTEQAGLLLARGQQVEELHQRLLVERQALEGREATLARAEQTLGALQEQVRRRSEELDARQKEIEHLTQQLEAGRAEQEARFGRAEQLQQQAAAELDRLRQELLAQTEELHRRGQEVAAREEATQTEDRRLQEAQQLMAGQRQALASERIGWEVERQAALEKERQARVEFARAREEAQALTRQLPELELRARGALERLGRAREHLREHLAEVHSYARQSRDDLETARKQVQGEVERVRQQELELEVARDEHRLAVADFRHQLIEWQGRVGEMKQALQLNSSQLELRQAAVEEQARQVAETGARLQAEVAVVERERQQVAEKRGEMDRHLGDMAEWYRRKWRELAGVDVPLEMPPGEGDLGPTPPGTAPAEGAPGERNPARAVLTLNDEIEPADRQLGELLASLGLVDQDTLQALWGEARRQRRSLRQLLLAGNFLTVHQMALMEAGNLDALMLGPVRIIDKLPSTSREAVYRVFDPRRNSEAVLRHLAESEMSDAVRPDEFGQRFAAATAVRHGNVAAVLEVLSIAERPAALLEWVQGLPGSDWPGLVAAPGVWYRLVSQAAVALQAAHAAGLCHGHLEAGSFVLTPGGALKLCGLGEPRWLAGFPLVTAPGGADTGPADEESPAGDLAALGRIATAWAALPPGGKGKSKPLPGELHEVLARLTADDPARRYGSAQELVEALENAGANVPSSATAWERLLAKVREQAPAEMRESA